mmetsp:Transcript_8030/g.33137  ORF Transcript_8030/g.33137 Transcript_8030/m.33137 type:complete len:125 (+) Transcript_8030:463-837(+)
MDPGLMNHLPSTSCTAFLCVWPATRARAVVDFKAKRCAWSAVHTLRRGACLGTPPVPLEDVIRRRCATRDEDVDVEPSLHHRQRVRVAPGHDLMSVHHADPEPDDVVGCGVTRGLRMTPHSTKR